MELSTTKPTQSLDREEIKRTKRDLFQHKLCPAVAALGLHALQVKAKERMAGLIKRREKIRDIDTAKEELEKALNLMNGIQQNLASGNDEDEELTRPSAGSRKRKRYEAVNQMEKATEVVERMEREVINIALDISER